MTAELQRKAQEYINRNEWDQAIAYLEQAQGREPDNTRILGPLAFCYSRLRQHGRAIDIYERLCRLEPSVARWRYSLGYQYYDQQEYSQAIDHFDKALEIEPGYIPVLYRKGYALSTMEAQRGQALTTFEQCRKAYCGLSEGEAKKRAQKYYAGACYQQGKLFLKAGNKHLAEERLLEAVEMKSEEADVHYALGKLYFKMGRFDQAISSLETAQDLSQKPQHYILDQLGRAYAENGRLREAIGTYEQMPHDIRKRAYILRNMGTVYMKLEDWHKAEQTLGDAVKAEHRNHNGQLQSRFSLSAFGEMGRGSSRIQESD